MAFRDLDEFLVVTPVRLPIRGKTYEFPGAISARSWLLVQRMGEQFDRARRAEAAGEEYDPDEVAIDDTEEVDLRGELFGPAEAEMVADGLTSAHLERVFFTLIAYHLSGIEAAEAVWEHAERTASGKPPAPNRATRRKGTSAASRGSRAGSKSPKKAAASGGAAS